MFGARGGRLREKILFHLFKTLNDRNTLRIESECKALTGPQEVTYFP